MRKLNRLLVGALMPAGKASLTQTMMVSTLSGDPVLTFYTFHPLILLIATTTHDKILIYS